MSSMSPATRFSVKNLRSRIGAGRWVEFGRIPRALVALIAWPEKAKAGRQPTAGIARPEEGSVGEIAHVRPLWSPARFAPRRPACARAQHRTRVPERQTSKVPHSPATLLPGNQLCLSDATHPDAVVLRCGNGELPG